MDSLERPAVTCLRLKQAQWDQIRLEAERLAPEEACGLLAGVGEQVWSIFPVTNELHSTVRYRMEPSEQLRAFQQIEENGWELLGIYHSHPRGPYGLSTTDISEAFYPDSVYVVVSGGTGEWLYQGFLVRDGQVSGVPIRVEE